VRSEDRVLEAPCSNTGHGGSGLSWHFHIRLLFESDLMPHARIRKNGLYIDLAVGVAILVEKHKLVLSTDRNDKVCL